MRFNVLALTEEAAVETALGYDAREGSCECDSIGNDWVPFGPLLRFSRRAARATTHVEWLRRELFAWAKWVGQGADVEDEDFVLDIDFIDEVSAMFGVERCCRGTWDVGAVLLTLNVWPFLPADGEDPPPALFLRLRYETEMQNAVQAFCSMDPNIGRLRTTDSMIQALATSLATMCRPYLWDRPAIPFRDLRRMYEKR